MSLKNVGSVRVSGNTYAHRDAIKRLGGRWDGGSRSWVIDIANHPSNTMRGRPGLDGELRSLAKGGCKVEYE